MHNPMRSMIYKFEQEIKESNVKLDQDDLYVKFADIVIEMCVDKGKTQGENLYYLRDLLGWR